MGKTSLLGLCLLSTLSVPAYALDDQDAGEYVLLNQQEQPTPMQMRYILQANGQWIMDGKQGNGDWQSVCRGDGQCRLQPASASEVAQWKTHLPSQWQAHSFSCIRNIAFAFCRVSHKDHANRRAYWWFSLLNNQIHALPLNRLP